MTLQTKQKPFNNKRVLKFVLKKKKSQQGIQICHGADCRCSKANKVKALHFRRLLVPLCNQRSVLLFLSMTRVLHSEVRARQHSEQRDGFCLPIN